MWWTDRQYLFCILCGRRHHEDKTFCENLAGSLPVHGQQQTEVSAVSVY